MPDQSLIKCFKAKSPISLNSVIIILILNILSQSSASQLYHPKPPPIPILPIPSSHQLSWQQSEMTLFLHFGPNTFTDSEWGAGHACVQSTSLNATQWVNVAKDAGFSRVILTAKHHDGFCLWPSQYTDYSVKSSPWRMGDVVGEFAEAAKIAAAQLGLYLSPWDRHEPELIIWRSCLRLSTLAVGICWKPCTL